jgi:sugar phosphate isomerase/epimerase
MKISLYTRISDLIPAKETFFDRINDFLFNDPKRRMFKKLPTDFIFSSIKNSGVEGLELITLANLPEKDIQVIKKMIQKHDLKIFSIHQSNDSLLGIDLQEIERLCVIAKEFSAEVVVLHINAFQKNLLNNTFLNELKNLQKKYDVTLAIENVAKSPFSLTKEMYKAGEFSRAVKLADLSITFDTTHLGQVGDDICEFYLKNKGNIVNIHISDYRQNWLNKVLMLANGTHLPLGKGELKIIEFLKILIKENYQGLVTMEINGDLETLCQNARLIKDYTS